MSFTVEFRERADLPWSFYSKAGSLVGVLDTVRKLRRQGFLARALNANGECVA